MDSRTLRRNLVAGLPTGLRVVCSGHNREPCFFAEEEAKTYLISCQRYIELNPVRAAMVDDPAHYRWTSYRSNALWQAAARLTPHPLYLALDRNEVERCTAYQALFRAHLDGTAIDDIRLALNLDQPLGNPRFYATIERMTSIRREAKPRGRPRSAVTNGVRA